MCERCNGKVRLVPQDAGLWVSIRVQDNDEDRFVWTKNLNECMFFVFQTDDEIGFYHLNSNNYLLNRAAKKSCKPGEDLIVALKNRKIIKTTIYTNPQRFEFDKATLQQVINNFNLPRETTFMDINWGSNANLCYDVKTHELRRTIACDCLGGIDNGNVFTEINASSNNRCCIIQ